jgi:hypothetical protein
LSPSTREEVEGEERRRPAAAIWVWQMEAPGIKVGGDSGERRKRRKYMRGTASIL